VSPTKSKAISVLHGPNLNLLGKRQPKIYGSVTLAQINQNLEKLGRKRGFEVSCAQCNCEGKMVDFIQEISFSEEDPKGTKGLIINPGAYGHTSIAIRDALIVLHIPVIEVHLSNIYARESFRRKSLISPVVQGSISGLGARGYTLALEALFDLIN
jgi:3-dehydroquinate dehydratase-2